MREESRHHFLMVGRARIRKTAQSLSDCLVFNLDGYHVASKQFRTAGSFTWLLCDKTLYDISLRRFGPIREKRKWELVLLLANCLQSTDTLHRGTEGLAHLEEHDAKRIHVDFVVV